MTPAPAHLPPPSPQALLTLRLRVENANAVSGPFTYGLPAVTAFTGFTHALQRRLQAPGADPRWNDLRLDGTGVVCHRFTTQVSRPTGKRTRVFHLARHPVRRDGAPGSLIEDGCVHFEVTLVIGLRGGDALLTALNSPGLQVEMAQQIHAEAMSMRLGGGSLQPLARVSVRRPAATVVPVDDGTPRRLRPLLLPGFVLMDRGDLLRRHLADLRQQQPEASALDALLDLYRLRYAYVPPVVAKEDARDTEPSAGDAPAEPASDGGTKAEWPLTPRPHPGWLVPLPVGYAALSPLQTAGTVPGARDDETPFRLVETLTSLGEWRSPHRLADPFQLSMLWYHDARPDQGLYLCHQPFATPLRGSFPPGPDSDAEAALDFLNDEPLEEAE